MLLNWLIRTSAIGIAAYVLPGVSVENILAALIAALVLGLVNTFIKPFLILLTLPLNILTLGLFTLGVNALLILLASKIVPGFEVDGILSAILFSIILWFVNQLFKNNNNNKNEQQKEDEEKRKRIRVEAEAIKND